MSANTEQSGDQEGGERRGHAPVLPSYGISELFGDIGDPDRVRNLLRQVNDGGLQRNGGRQRSSDSQSSNGAESYSQNSVDTGQLLARGPGVVAMETEKSVESLAQYDSLHNTSMEHETARAQADDQLGRTTPIQTIDQNQLRDVIASAENSDESFNESELFGAGAEEVLQENTLEPEITVTCPPYQRFRYESERPQLKRGPKQRVDINVEDDKNTLAEIQVTNFSGRLHLTAYCVDQCGSLHPFRLHGDRCTDGVYHAVLRITDRDTKVKLTMGVTTPLTKQYEAVIRSKKQRLVQLHADGAKKPATHHDIKDKNTVYLQVEVLMETTTDTKRLVLDPVIIHNRKTGSEFKVDTVQPDSAPVTGSHPGNVNKHRVLIVVTEGTAFPNNVGVRIRERINGQFVWQSELIKGSDLRIIRKTVIEFEPPPYNNLDTTEPVNVELCLCDIDSQQETDPVAFVYTPVHDEYGIINKAKKRKIDSPISRGFVTGSSRETRKSMTASYSQNFSSRANVTEGSLNRQHTQSIPTPSLSTGIKVKAHSEGANDDHSSQPAVFQSMSVHDDQQYRSTSSERWGQLNTNPQVVTTPDPNSTLVTSAASVFTSVTTTSSSQQTCLTTPSSATTGSSQFEQSSWLQSLSGQQGKTLEQEGQQIQFTEQQQHLLQQLQSIQQQTSMSTTTTPAELEQQKGFPPPQPEQAQQQQQQLQQQQKLQQQQQILQQQQLQLQLKKAEELKHMLQPNQSFKVICGRVVIVNDDINLPAVATQEPPAPMLQNVGGQPVIVQSMQPQHPTSDTSQAEPRYPPSNQPYQCPTSGPMSATIELQNLTAMPPAGVDQALDAFIQLMVRQPGMLAELTAGWQPPSAGVQLPDSSSILQAVHQPGGGYIQPQLGTQSEGVSVPQVSQLGAPFTVGPNQMYIAPGQQQTYNAPYSYGNTAEPGLTPQFTYAWSANQQTPQMTPDHQTPDDLTYTQPNTGMASSYSQNNLDEDDVEIDSGVGNHDSSNKPDNGDGYFINDVASNVVVSDIENGCEASGGCEVSYPDNEILTVGEPDT